MLVDQMERPNVVGSVERERRGEEEDLHADGDVDAAAEGGRDGARRQTEWGEETSEGGTERSTRPLLRHRHAAANAVQRDASGA